MLPSPNSAKHFSLSGFTLIELAIVVIILSLILGGGLSILQARVDQARYDETIMKMDAIEQAFQDYMLGRSRLVCPAAATLPSTDTNYGQEMGTIGTCTDGAGIVSLGSGVAGGTIPTKKLNLPDDYMYDGWGRRFDYAVQAQMTTNGMSYSMTDPSVGAITIKNTTAAVTPITTKAIAVVISHGPNGHGGYTKSGARLNAGITNADELDNCNCTSGATAGTIDASYVQKPSTEDSSNSLNNFDDIVRYYMRYNYYLPSTAHPF